VARSRLESAYRRSRHLAEVVLPARRRVVEHALRQLNAMAVSVFDLLRYQRELLDSELSAVDALLDYWLARAGWDAVAAGGRAPDSPLPEARALPAAPPSPGGH
jgi:outer membrane protein TolC